MSLRFKVEPDFFLSDECREASERFNRSVNAAVADLERRRLEKVERRILAGENRIEISAGGFLRHREVYTVPIWHREPIRRLRVEWARWKARR